MEICDKLLCTGCGACSVICPFGCIEMCEDELGHLYPNIDENRCTGCGLCRKRCPVNSDLSASAENEVYAAWSLDNEDRRSSTSGGFASVVSKKVIDEGGVVYGSALTDNGIEHIRADNERDLIKLKGSKYVQSPVVHIYRSLKEDLEKGRRVLFIGTPCQTAGVRAYLNKDYEKLLLIDLICTGVPPQKLLWEHLGYIDKKPQGIRFRDETGSRLTVFENDQTVYCEPVWNDYFFMGFSKHLYFRESCYKCPFAKDERFTDITIGDFWGLGLRVPFNHDIKDGVSVVVAHTDKGNRLINECRDVLFTEKRSFEEAVSYNIRYHIPSEKHKNFNSFKELYRKKGFKYALKRSLKKERCRYFIYRSLRRIKVGRK